MAKPTPLSGFPEFLPAGRAVEQRVIASLSRTFELHGFASLETRAAEPLDQLLRKGETSKEVYVLRRLQAQAPDAAEATAGSGDSGLGLHFDLTVPFARYVLEHAGKLDFPFRRYQIQKVWRGERPQEGRYREFTQADIDIVGRDTLAFHHDIEVARVMVEALDQLARPDLLGLPGFTLQVNNRKLIQGFYQGLGAPDPARVMQLVDKLDKLPAAQVRELLVADAGLTTDQADKCLALAEISAADGSFADQITALGVSDPLLDEGVAELVAVIEGCAGLISDQVTVLADLKIARGLDYYTGTVFETRLRGYESLGSICSGGRYDALASEGRTTYPGVGISLGVSRVLVPLVTGGVVNASRSVPSAVLVALPDEESRAACDAIAQQLRANGTPVEVAANPQKFGKQIRYAERRGIPYVWFPAIDDPAAANPTDSAEHQVKDIRSGEQVAADPATWVPPAHDLLPEIISVIDSLETSQ